jgi:spore maturation protein CgeB
MAEQMKRLKNEPELRRSLAEKGLETIRARHTCGHRADELLGIVASLRSSRAKPRGAAQRVSTSLDTNELIRNVA